MDQLCMAVIGCGGIVRNVHAKNLRENPRIRVRYCVDINPEAAENVAALCGAERVAGDLDEALADPEVRAVLIATLPETHVDISMRAASAGKHILCEKPMGAAYRECVRLKGALDAGGVKYMIGFNYRLNSAVSNAFGHFTPDFSLAHIMAEAEPARVEHNFLHNFCHAADLANHFHGSRPVRVTATGNGAPCLIADAEGKLIANIHYRNGSIATIATGSRCISPYLGKWYYKYCDSSGNVAEIINYKRSMVRGGTCREFSDENSYFSGHAAELDHFADAVLNDVPVKITYEDGLLCMLVMEAVKLSFETGLPVDIENLREDLK